MGRGRLSLFTAVVLIVFSFLCSRAYADLTSKATADVGELQIVLTNT